MIIPHNTLKQNETAISKYKDRLVKIFFKERGLWFSNNDSFAGSKSIATCIPLAIALTLVAHVPEHSHVEYHFEDTFGDRKPDINDFEDEDKYNCPNIIWGHYNKFK